jgi:hypothetical protein
MPYAQPFGWPQMPMMQAYPAYPYMMPQAYGYPQYGYNNPQAPYMANQGYGHGYQAPMQQPAEPPAKRARHQQLQPETPFHSTMNDPNAWRNCSQAGCQYVGPGNDVALHEQDRHLIYPEGYVPERSEEEEAYLRKGG